MPCPASQMLADAASLDITNLDDRSLRMALAGEMAIGLGLTGPQIVADAIANGWGKVGERGLYEAIAGWESNQFSKNITTVIADANADGFTAADDRTLLVIMCRYIISTTIEDALLHAEQMRFDTLSAGQLLMVIAYILTIKSGPNDIQTSLNNAASAGFTKLDTGMLIVAICQLLCYDLFGG